MSAALERARLMLREVRAAGEPGWKDTGALAELLYLRWYHASSNGLRLCPDVAAYRTAHALGAGFEPGWRVIALRPDAGPGAIVATRGGETRVVYPPDYVPAVRHRLAVAPGDEVLTATRLDDLIGGFWHLWSAGWRQAPPQRLLRVYFQVAAGREAAFVARASAHAPPAAVWSLKILAGAHPAGRTDAAVLYLDRNDSIRVDWLTRVIGAVAPVLVEGAPPLTAPIATGVGWAEDPGGGVSFGEDRCRLLAGAALARPAALDGAASWRRAVAQAFAREGLELARPHLQGARRRNRAHVA